MNKNVCIVCGFSELKKKQYENMPANPQPVRINPPYEDVWGAPSFERCGCCGFVPGRSDVEDEGDVNFSSEYLVKWYLKTYRAFPKINGPFNTKLIEQLKAAGIPVPPEIGPE